VAFLIAAPIGIVGLDVRTRLLDSPAVVAVGAAGGSLSGLGGTGRGRLALVTVRRG
jgi:precorrin isomerase